MIDVATSYAVWKLLKSDGNITKWLHGAARHWRLSQIEDNMAN